MPLLPARHGVIYGRIEALDAAANRGREFEMSSTEISNSLNPSGWLVLGVGHVALGGANSTNPIGAEIQGAFRRGSNDPSILADYPNGFVAKVVDVLVFGNQLRVGFEPLQ